MVDEIPISTIKRYIITIYNFKKKYYTICSAGAKLFVSSICINYESCKLKTTQVIMSEKNIMIKFICDL